jgi:NAD(P)-dependent dehydrogenase (short-subunit alcohol dehydrogenase family)
MLKASAPSRVVTVSSVGHKWAPLDFKDLQSERNYSSVKVYAKSKTANILFTVHLADLLKGGLFRRYSVTAFRL